MKFIQKVIYFNFWYGFNLNYTLCCFKIIFRKLYNFILRQSLVYRYGHQNIEYHSDDRSMKTSLYLSPFSEGDLIGIIHVSHLITNLRLWQE